MDFLVSAAVFGVALSGVFWLGYRFRGRRLPGVSSGLNEGRTRGTGDVIVAVWNGLSAGERYIIAHWMGGKSVNLHDIEPTLWKLVDIANERTGA